MQTPNQLRDRLLELGIARDLRALTDWRQKGLLPPLRRASLGRGRGVQRYWSDDVLDQAIAVDWLLKRCGRVDETLFGLWLAGYPVDHAAAQRAWIEDVKRLQHRRRQTALRYRGGFPGLGRSWWKQLKSHAAFTLPWWRQLPARDRENVSTFLGDTEEWLRDDEERDDEAYRYAVADLIITLTKIDRKAFYRQIDKLWPDIDPKSLFAITPYLELVESMSLEELEASQESLIRVAGVLRHLAELVGSADRVNAVVIPLLLMRKVLGTVIVRILVRVGREAPDLPLAESLSILHDLAMSVQYIDINKNNDGRFVLAERVHAEWEVTKRKLAQLWGQAEDNEDQPVTPNGPRGPVTG